MKDKNQQHFIRSEKQDCRSGQRGRTAERKERLHRKTGCFESLDERDAEAGSGAAAGDGQAYESGEERGYRTD